MRRLLPFAVIVACSGDRPPDPAAGPNAPELADPESLSEANAWADMGTPRADRVYMQQSSNDRGKGVDGGVRLLRNGNKDLNNWICASQDAELGKPLVPAEFDLPSCPESYVRGAVAARFEGSGVMTRFWMTAFSMRGAPADDEILRVYVDDELVVEKKVSEVADGTAGPMFAPPFGAGATEFVSWRYPVVFGKKLIVVLDNLGTLDNVYHITDVALDRTPRARRRNSDPLPRRDPNPDLQGFAKYASIHTVTAGATESRLINWAVGELTIRHPERLSDVDLRLTFDGVVTVDMPIRDFFAAWEESPTTKTLALLSDDTDLLHFRLPMRAEKQLELAVTNRGSMPVDVGLSAMYLADFVGGRLFAIRSDTREPREHPLFSTTGPGRWLGTCALLEGHATSGSDALVGGLNFLEGDERVKLDGRTLLGTGTEDYFDSAFYFIGGARSSPFAAWWGVREDRTTMPWKGRATACRWHVLNDAIDFNSSIEASLEIGNGDPSLLDRYRTVAYFYK